MSFFSKLKTKIYSIYVKISAKTLKRVQLSIKIANKLKEAVNGTQYDSIQSLVVTMVGLVSNYSTIVDKGADAVQAWLKTNLPKIILGLQITEVSLEYTNEDELYAGIIALLNKANDSAKDSVYKELASQFLDYISDGEFTTSERNAYIELVISDLGSLS